MYFSTCVSHSGLHVVPHVGRCSPGGLPASQQAVHAGKPAEQESNSKQQSLDVLAAAMRLPTAPSCSKLTPRELQSPRVAKEHGCVYCNIPVTVYVQAASACPHNPLLPLALQAHLLPGRQLGQQQSQLPQTCSWQPPQRLEASVLTCPGSSAQCSAFGSVLYPSLRRVLTLFAGRSCSLCWQQQTSCCSSRHPAQAMLQQL